MSDNINHPKHYTSHPSGVECITIAEHFNFNVGNAIKYLWRAGLKTPSVYEDLEKARWYIDREIARLAPEMEQIRKRASVWAYGVVPAEVLKDESFAPPVDHVPVDSLSPETKKEPDAGSEE